MHFALLFLILQYFQQVLGFNLPFAGCAYLPLTAVVFIISNFVPALAERFGIRFLLITGCILVAASLVGFSELEAESTYLKDVIPSLLLHSIGIALVFAQGSIAILDGVEDQDAGVMSGILQIGEAVGIAAITSIYMANLSPGDFSSGFHAAFLIASGVSVLAAVIAFFTLSGKNSSNQ